MILPGEFIMELGKPTRNGHLYEASNFQNLEESYSLVNELPCLGSMPAKILQIEESDVIGEVTNIRIDGNKILADVKTMESVIEQLRTPIQLSPICMGILIPEGEHKKVTNLHISHFVLDHTNKPNEEQNGVSS